jgi:glycosyltransferase involved in cell wall biosynthesis
VTGALVSIVIPTRRRPQSLAVALRSAFAQQSVDPGLIELIVVDNDAEAASRPTVEALASAAPFPVNYLSEARPGVASARNAALTRVSGRFIAFLDDDEEAPPGWLAALLEAQARFDADVVFGAVRGRCVHAAPEHRDYLERFFSRLGPAEAGLIDAPYGCGDSLIRTDALPSRQPFALTQNHIGGEDDLLFAAMKAAGRRFAWSPEAWVWEDPVPERQTLAYALRRAFAYGQGPAHSHWRRGELWGSAFWMGVGAGQTVVFGALAAAKWLLRRPDRAQALDKAARGLGKVLWFPPFKPRFYGLPLPKAAAMGPSMPAPVTPPA